jgi:hypothetical protein
MSRFNGIVLLVALSIASIVAAPANSVPLAGAPPDDSVAAFALHWYTEMQAGKFDRTQSLLQARLVELGTGLRLVRGLYEYE